MSDENQIENSNNNQDESQGTRSNIIKAVTSPLGFFTLAILVIESVFLSLVATGNVSEMIPFILFLVIAGFVFVLAVFKPQAFYQSDDRRLVEDKMKVIKDLKNKLKISKKGGFEKFRLILEYDTSNIQGLFPTRSADFADAKCTYSILDGNQLKIENEPVIIQTDISIHIAGGVRKIIPYIDILVPSQLADPSVRIALSFKGQDWNLYGCRIKQRMVELS